MNIEADTTQINSTPKSYFEGFTISPEVCIGLPKALPRKKTVNNRRKMKSIIPTDSPVKQQLIDRKSKVKPKTIKKYLKRTIST